MCVMPIANNGRGKDLKIDRMRAEGTKAEFCVGCFLAKGLLVAVLLAAYFFVVTSFFQGWQNAKFFDDAPDLVFAAVSITLLFHALSMKRSGDKNLIIGLSLVSLVKLGEVALQEAQAMAPLGSLELVLWEPVIIMFGLGFLFILLYLGERVR